MLSKMRHKLVVGWYAVKDADTGRWGYVNFVPDRRAAVEGPFDFRTASELCNQRNNGETPCSNSSPSARSVFHSPAAR